MKELTNHNQWVVWKTEKRNGKPTKPPYNPKTGRYASHNDPQTWGTYQQAKEAKGFDGKGFVFTEGDTYCGIDLDKCRDPETGEVEPWALKIVDAFKSYTEISPSGTGLHTIIKGKLLGGGIKTKHVEVYDRLRYFTVTENQYGDCGEIREAQGELDCLVERLENKQFKSELPPVTNVTPDINTQNHSETPNNQTVSEKSNFYDDNRLIDKMLASANGGAILSLLDGHHDAYPSQSEADQALCNHLAFWTDKDPQAMGRIFRRSGLMREKWDKKHYGDGRTYGEATIEKAITGTTETYTRQPQKHTGSNQHTNTRKASRGLKLTELSTQYDSEVSWVWRKHFPLGLPVIVNGREGMGKTTICLQAAKEILSQHAGGNIVWLATEGAVQDTVSKMVERDLYDDRFMVGQKANETFKWDFYLQSDRHELESLLEDLKPIICVFIDSIRGMSRLDDNDPKNGDIIQQVNSIVCDKYRAGLVYIDHHGKGQKTNLLDKAVGTTAKTSSVRGVLSVMPASKYKRIIKTAKANISTMGGELEVLKVGSNIIIQEPVTNSDDTMKDRAEEFLISLFSEQKSMQAIEVYRMGEEQGFSGSLLKTVKKDLGIQSHRDGEQAAWKWVWPYI